MLRKIWVLLGILLCFVVFTAEKAQAQAVLTVPAKLIIGQSIDISYSDPTKAGQSITVRIDLGGVPNQIETVKIDLDDQGKGTASWKVPDVLAIGFNAPGVAEQIRFPQDS